MPFRSLAFVENVTVKSTLGCESPQCFKAPGGNVTFGIEDKTIEKSLFNKLNDFEVSFFLKCHSSPHAAICKMKMVARFAGAGELHDS